MPAAPACGDRAIDPEELRRLLEPGDQIGWNERRVAGHGDDMAKPPAAAFRKAGENARQRTGAPGHRIREDGQAEGLEARGIAIAVEDQPLHLGREPAGDVADHRLAGKREKPLVAPPPPPPPAPGGHDAPRPRRPPAPPRPPGPPRPVV